MPLYDEFLEKLRRGPLILNEKPRSDDGAHDSQEHARRTVMRLEFAGFRRVKKRDVPYVREVLSCGHPGYEQTLGQYDWQHPRKASGCHECGKVLYPDDWSGEYLWQDVEAAVRAEREACAQIAEAHHRSAIAEEIRARGPILPQR